MVMHVSGYPFLLCNILVNLQRLNQLKNLPLKLGMSLTRHYFLHASSVQVDMSLMNLQVIQPYPCIIFLSRKDHDFRNFLLDDRRW